MLLWRHKSDTARALDIEIPSGCARHLPRAACQRWPGTPKPCGTVRE
jgi:hypothetical protein